MRGAGARRVRCAGRSTSIRSRCDGTSHRRSELGSFGSRGAMGCGAARIDEGGFMARRSRRSQPSGLPYLAVGLALGLAVAAGVYFSDLRSGAGLPESAQRARSETAERAPRAETAAPAAAGAALARPEEASRGTSASSTATSRPAAAAERSSPPAASETEPSFDFYEILPQYEVLVP